MPEQRWLKPAAVRGRDHEWSLLTNFLTDPAPQLRLAIVSGRRRNGKSFLLEALTEACGGLYLSAVQEEGRVPALRRLTQAIAAHAGVRPDALHLDDWRDLFTVALEVVARAPGAPLVVVDELPYLLEHSPEITGFLQLIYDQSQRNRAPGGRIVLCGSALSVMSELLSGTKPLRGRAVVDLRLPAFDYRSAREHWRIDDPQVALQVDAVLGGAPGYRPLAAGAPPQTQEEFDAWVVATLLDPGRALYSRVEAEFLLREDPRITRRTLYYDVLSAVAGGASTPTQVGSLLGRQRAAMVAPLELLESTGYLRREQDLLKARHPVIRVADPVIRFNQLITLPMVDLIERRRGPQVWATSRATYQSKILGPHFEEISREWTRSFASDEAGVDLGTVGACEITDPAAREKYEVDVVALSPGQRPRHTESTVALIGEAKATVHPRGLADLERLQHIRDVLAGQGHGQGHGQPEGITLALFSLHGFHPDLLEAVGRRRDVLLVDVPTLYATRERTSA